MGGNGRTEDTSSRFSGVASLIMAVVLLLRMLQMPHACHSRERSASGILPKTRKDSGQVYPPLAAPKATRAGMTKRRLHVALSMVVLLLSLIFVRYGGAFVSRDLAVSTSNPKLQAPGNFHNVKEQSLKTGKLLVASEKIRDPRFAGTVILLAGHDSHGAAGLILNRPTGAKRSHAFPNMKSIQETPHNVFFGGPVAREMGTIIFTSSRDHSDSFEIFDGIFISSSIKVIEGIIANRKPEQKFRIYSGYAGWSPGQLEREIERGDWLVVKGTPDIIFNESPEKIWESFVPRGKGITI